MYLLTAADILMSDAFSPGKEAKILAFGNYPLVAQRFIKQTMKIISHHEKAKASMLHVSLLINKLG